MANKRLYLGNLPYTTTREEIIEFFAPRKILEVKIVVDRETQRPRGIAFVELGTVEEMQSAMQLDGCDLGGRSIKVNEAHERSSKSPKSKPVKGDFDDRKRQEREDFAETWKTRLDRR